MAREPAGGNRGERRYPVVLRAPAACATCAPLKVTLAKCSIRPWRLDDADSLVRHANDRGIWENLRDGFPHPYGPADAESFLAGASQPPLVQFAIEVDGAAVGGIGCHPGRDVERISGEIGYWLGRALWGRGIMTEAVAAATARFFEIHELERVFAVPYADNLASIRVLEKAGYVREGHLRSSALKDGQLKDQLLYAAYRRTLS